MKTRANAKDDVARELRMRLKRAMDEMGVTLPSMNTVMLAGLEGAQRVRGANPPRTRPTPVATADGKGIWKPKRGGKAAPRRRPPAGRMPRRPRTARR
jgi:small conductance mechanosensitive channel